MDLDQRLQAVLAADVAGFSALMSEDERSTIAALDYSRRVFKDEIASHSGRLVDTAGDSVLAVFHTAIAAVTTAVAVQTRLASAVSEAPAPPMQFRMGIHLGDIFASSDGSVYGDGVNIAARLQTLARPGGLVVSAAIQGVVRQQQGWTFLDLGTQTVKNIKNPIHAFELRTASETEKSPGALTATARAAVDLSAPIRGFEGRPAVAVLPFANLSVSPDEDYFGDGLAEDISTRLAMWRLIPVIARSSSFQYRGSRLDLRAIGRALNAAWIVQGSVRRSGNKIRVAAQLIDAETGHHLWAQRYDRVIDDVFALQDELTEGIVATLEDRVGRAVFDRVKFAAPSNLAAWESVHRALWHAYRLNPSDMALARTYCARALAVSPEMPHALAILANLHRLEGLFYGVDLGMSMRSAVEFASRAVAADPNDPWACGTLGLMLATVGRLDESITVSRRAIELNPSGTLGYNALGTASLFLGNWDEGVEAMSTAIRINPADPMLSASLTALAFNHLMNREFDRAREVATLAVNHEPMFPAAPRVLASTLGHCRRLEEARHALDVARQRVPGRWSEESFRATLPFRQEPMLQHFLSGLRKAGWVG